MTIGRRVRTSRLADAYRGAICIDNDNTLHARAMGRAEIVVTLGVQVTGRSRMTVEGNRVRCVVCHGAAVEKTICNATRRTGARSCRMGPKRLHRRIGLEEVYRSSKTDVLGSAGAHRGTRTETRRGALEGGINHGRGLRSSRNIGKTKTSEGQHAQAQGCSPSPHKERHSHGNCHYTKNPGSTDFVCNHSGGVSIVAQDQAQDHANLAIQFSQK